MKIRFYPDVDLKDLDSGVISEISWQRMTDHLDKAFNITPDERIVGITVSEYSIRAKIEYLKKPKK